MMNVLRDVRFTLRLLWRSPGFTPRRIRGSADRASPGMTAASPRAGCYCSFATSPSNVARALSIQRR